MTVNTKNRRKGAFAALPPGYELYRRIDLTQDRSALKAVVLFGMTAALALIVPMLFVHSPKEAFDMPAVEAAACIAASVTGMIVYIFLHEWAHGLFIRIFTGEKGAFGFDFRSFMAYAKSDWFFARGPYIIIALAPLAIWTAVIGLLLSDMKEKYFWYLYAVQIFNVTGASGDIYVAAAVLRMPRQVLAKDNGASMDFYMETGL